MQYIKNNMLIIDIDKSLRKGPVIKKKGIKENNITGRLWKINFSFLELNDIYLIININDYLDKKNNYNNTI